MIPHFKERLDCIRSIIWLLLWSTSYANAQSESAFVDIRLNIGEQALRNEVESKFERIIEWTPEMSMGILVG
jgi:hypothetical protein